MGNSPVDRDIDYMYQTYGTKRLITDYWTKPPEIDDDVEKLDENKQNPE
jgi:hypothetical protein